MIDNLFSLVFRCRHRRLTRPVTRISGGDEGETYVVCLDCAKRFAYDLQEMKMGKALPAVPAFGLLPPQQKSKMSRKLLLSIPFAFAIGVFVKFKTKKNTPE